MIWQPGQQLKTRNIRIDRELGRGGYGITYLAWNVGLACPVVIKSPHTHLCKDPGFIDYVDRFRKEGQNLARLADAQHPAIVRVADYFDEGEIPCLMMDFIKGETLHDRIQQSGDISEELVVSWIVTIAEALAQVHELGIVHRDANPNNIIIQPNDKPILIDFGIALEIQPRPTSALAALGGHPFYAPYEQIAKKEGDRSPKVDIYCLAAALYYGMTGQDPDRCTDRKVSILEGKDCLAEPQTIKPTISDRINHAILSGMQMDPDDRPSSMKAWIKYLTTDDELLSKIQPPTLESLPLERLEFTTIEINEKAEIIAQPTKSVQSFDEKLNDELDLKMIIIPGGSFTMGSPEDELRSYNDEKPQHLVTVPSFAIGQFTITQAQWRAVAQLPKVKLKLNPEPSFHDGDDRPVERINWFEAVEFCDRLTKYTRKPYRLPSEAEWEYACRAGTTTPFNFGPTIATDFANYRGVDDIRENNTILGSYGEGPKGNYRGGTTDVTKFLPNGNGLYDVHGNVWEWCQDHWHPGYENAPIDGSAWLENDVDENADRTMRGGSCSNSPQNCRSAFRITNSPDGRLDTVGFRVMFPLSPRTL